MLSCIPAKIIRRVGLLMLTATLMSCGGNRSSIPPPSIPNIAGPWEFTAISTTGQNTGAVTGIEVSLSEGQVLVNGLNQPNGQITAKSNQIAFVSLAPTTLNITDFGGACGLGTANDLSGSVTSLDGQMQFSFTENGYVYNVTGTLAGDGKSMLNGTYTAQSGQGCASDPGGMITGVVVSRIAGNFGGKMCPLSAICSNSQQFADTVSAIASENSSSILTLNLTLTGTDTAALTLTGPVTGNSFQLQGTVQGQAVTYDGYYEAINGVSSIYLVNATNSAAPNYVGTLAIPH